MSWRNATTQSGRTPSGKGRVPNRLRYEALDDSQHHLGELLNGMVALRMAAPSPHSDYQHPLLFLLLLAPNPNRTPARGGCPVLQTTADNGPPPLSQPLPVLILLSNPPSPLHHHHLRPKWAGQSQRAALTVFLSLKDVQLIQSLTPSSAHWKCVGATSPFPKNTAFVSRTRLTQIRRRAGSWKRPTGQKYPTIQRANIVQWCV